MSKPGEADDPRRRILVHALALGALTGIPCMNARADVFGSTPSKLPAGQSIYRLSGTGTINGTKATLSSSIAPGDTVETGPASEMVFAVAGSAYVLRASSKLEIQKSSATALVVSGLRMLTGRVLAVFGKSAQPLRLQTFTATIGIRGTGVYLESDPEQTYFCTCYGITDIAATADKQSTETVSAKHHDKPLYIVAGASAGKNIRRAPFINHNDQELMLIETLVGRTPPFVFPGDDYSVPRRDY